MYIVKRAGMNTGWAVLGAVNHLEKENRRGGTGRQ